MNVYVLFIDIVGSTRETTDRQQTIQKKLTGLVSGTHDFQQARANGDLISLPTGDGMALVFMKQMQAPLRCAIEIAHALSADPFCEVRMGIHGGPVFVSEDINGNRNVSGAGINIAERVMSCGSAGHILLSSTVAESLRHLTKWRGKLTDLGEYRAKKDRVHIWNFIDGDIGSTKRLPAVSQKMIDTRNRLLGALIALALLAPVVIYLSWSDNRDRNLGIIVGIGLAPLVAFTRYFWTWWRIDPKRAGTRRL